MCGIFGAIGDSDDRTTFELGFYCESRGTDAGGLIWQRKYGDPSEFAIAKRPGAVTEQVIPQYEHALQSRMLIGHTRFATSGPAYRNENNHPHRGERFTLVHNGHVWNDDEFACKTACDSEAIVHALEQTPFEQSTTYGCIEYAARNLDGATTVAMVDKTDPQAVWLWRDDCHPLYTMKLDGAIYFASEEWMLQAASAGQGDIIEVRDYHAVRLDSDTVKGKMMPIVSRHPIQYAQCAYYTGKWDVKSSSYVNSDIEGWEYDYGKYKRGNPRRHSTAFYEKYGDTEPWPDSKHYATWHVMQYTKEHGCLDYKCYMCHDTFGSNWKWSPEPRVTKSGVMVHKSESCAVCQEKKKLSALHISPKLV